MNIKWSVATVAMLCLGCDDPTSTHVFDREYKCKIEGHEGTLSTSADELEGKSGDDWVTFMESEAVTELSGNETVDEIVVFLNNEENWVRTPHEVPFSRIISCQELDALADAYLERARKKARLEQVEQ